MRTPRILLLLLVATSLSSCSLYRNKGRDQFESRAGGNVRTEIGVSRADKETLQLTDDSSSCWMQDASEALWSTPEGAKLSVHRVNEKQISVCIATADPAPTSPVHEDISDE